MWSAILLAGLATPPIRYWLTKVDITPPELLPLGGYTARRGKSMTGVGDRLFARGLILEQGRRRLAVVVCEMLTTPESLVREVRSRLPADMELFLAATHTHCAPDSQMLNERMTFQIPGIATYRPRWLAWYAERIAKAAAPQGPGRALLRGTLELSHADNNRPRRRLGDPDQLVTRFACGTQTLLAEYEAHATLYNERENVTRGDWPGVLASKIDAPVLVGAIGDVSPKAEGKEPAERCENMASALLAVRQRIATSNPGLSWVREPIPLDKTIPHPSFAKSYGIPDSLAKSLVDRFAPTSTSVLAVRIGNLALVGIPGEPSSHLGRAIRDYGRTLGFESVLVISHVNGWMGYILGPEDYDRGGYEATLNFYGRNEGMRVVESGQAALRHLAQGAG